MVQSEKEKIRKEILKLMRNQEEARKHQKSLVIMKKFFSLLEFQKARTILFYASFDGEVETFEMMKQAQQMGKKVALPMISKPEKRVQPALVNNLEKDLENGLYGILQPKESLSQLMNATDLDLVVVPGVAFDKKNCRLGRGAGYYDRFLKNLPQKAFSVGLAFDFQIVDRLPTDTHDVSVSHVITN